MGSRFPIYHRPTAGADTPAGGDTPGAIDRTIGERIAELREGKGVSVETLSAALGITPAEMREIEAGTQRASAAVIFAICATLECNVALVLAGLR